MSNELYPKNWQVATLGAAVEVKSGVGFPKKYQGKTSGEYPVYKVGDISKAVTEMKGNLAVAGHYVSDSEAKELRGEIFRPGTTLFAKIGEAVKLNRRALVKREGLADNNVMAVIPINPNMDKFTHYFLRTVDLADVSRSTTVPSIRKGDIEDLHIAYPPLAEQKIIADKLDTLLAQVESSKARLERIPQILKRFRQSVLSDAVSGKLTEEWRAAQSYPDLVDELHDLAESVVANAPTNAQKIKLSKVYSEIEKPISLTFDIPKNWIICNLAKLCEPFTYGTSAKSKSDGEIPVLRMGNLQNGQLDWSDLVYTSDEQEIEKYKLSSGDVLFNRTNSPELVGKTAIYKGERKAIYAGYLIKARCLDLLLPDYLNYVLNSSYGKDYCRQVKSDGVSQSNINAQKLGAFVLPLPSLEEQTEIVTRVEQLFAYTDTIEQQVQNALARVNNLSQAILAKAFRGELTEQWRKDNPNLISGENSAEALLAKIKAEREAIQPKKKTRARKMTA